ncbi:hypothetical protein BMS3Abin03_02136 [bacterium BMS3Abin03]|nr:hypothetical protein BMS3Abin03_02136 [bacterium BMS3Abin03]
MKQSTKTIITYSFVALTFSVTNAQYVQVPVTPNPVSLISSIDSEYFPFDSTSKLIYESTFGEAECITRSNGGDYLQEFKSDDFKMLQRINIIDNNFCVIDLQQEINIFLFITHSIDVKYNEPAQMVKLPLAQNEKWKWTGIEYIDGTADTLLITTEYKGDEVITTPAGEFNCKKLEYVIRKSSGKVTKYYEWRTPGIGLVKLEADLDPGGFAGTIQKLLGYEEIYFTLKDIRKISSDN